MHRKGGGEKEEKNVGRDYLRRKREGKKRTMALERGGGGYRRASGSQVGSCAGAAKAEDCGL